MSEQDSDQSSEDFADGEDPALRRAITRLRTFRTIMFLGIGLLLAIWLALVLWEDSATTSARAQRRSREESQVWHNNPYSGDLGAGYERTAFEFGKKLKPICWSGVLIIVVLIGVLQWRLLVAKAADENYNDWLTFWIRRQSFVGGTFCVGLGLTLLGAIGLVFTSLELNTIETRYRQDNADRVIERPYEFRNHPTAPSAIILRGNANEGTYGAHKAKLPPYFIVAGGVAFIGVTLIAASAVSYFLFREPEWKKT